MLPDQSKLTRALLGVQKAVLPYHRMEASVAATVDAWQALDSDTRRQINTRAPKLVEGLIDLEYHAKRLVDA